MIEFIDAKKRLTNGVELTFPINTFCGPIFNELFVNGKSVKDLQKQLQTQAVKTEQFSNPQWKSFHKYTLKKNWSGTILEAILGIENKQFDVSLTVSCLDDREFLVISRFLENNPRFNFLGYQDGFWSYEYRIAKTTHSDIRSIKLLTSKPTEKSCTCILLLEL